MGRAEVRCPRCGEDRLIECDGWQLRRRIGSAALSCTRRRGPAAAIARPISQLSLRLRWLRLVPS